MASAVVERPTTPVLPSRAIERAARLNASRVFVRTPERDWTFAEIDERANRLANALRAIGVKPDDRVAVLRWNDVEHIEISFALLKLGAAMVNVNPRMSPAELSWQLADSGCEVLIASAAFNEALAALAGELADLRAVIVFGGTPEGHIAYEPLLAKAAGTPPGVATTPGTLAYIRYTSGTTGRPKGVVHDQQTIMAVTRNLLLDYVADMDRDDVFLALQGLYHGAGWFVLPCWLRGVPMVVVPRFDPEASIDAIDRFGATVVKTVPTILGRLLDVLGDRRERLRRVHTVVYGASPMPAAVLARGVDMLGPVFVQLYGQAESPMTITVLGKHEHEGRIGATGRAITLADVRVVDEDGRDVPAGDVGEVIVRGDHNMRGYWNRPREETEAVVRDGYVYTRDLGRLDDDGFLYLVDRKNDMIITGGLNVYPNEVEQVLYEHDGVLEAAVVGIEHADWGEQVTALVVPRSGRAVDAKELLRLAHGRLSDFKRPRQVAIVPSLPKNAAGKIVRREARDELWPRVAHEAVALARHERPGAGGGS